MFLANVRRFCPAVGEHSDSDLVSIARDLAGLAHSGAFGAVYRLGADLEVPDSEWNPFAFEVLATLYPLAVTCAHTPDAGTSATKAARSLLATGHRAHLP
ncbi:hypothetical protein [Demequina sp.]|uniref:hypothetical protein n=1 Tax=Demequina sp. TaxID=2050685 RepID=UPI0025C68B42|nr:hypothetical protein [Demequina sp.]